MVTIGNAPAVRSHDAPSDVDGYYSIGEAAARLGVSRVSIWRWIRSGRLPAARLGHRTTRIHSRDLDNLLASNLSEAPAAVSGRNRTDSRAPHADWWDLHGSEHLVQFYDSDAFLVDGVSAFIGAAVRAGEAALVVATPVHRQALEQRLLAYGLDLAAAQAAGRYMSLDAAETLARFMVDGMPDADQFAVVVGGVIARLLAATPRLRVFGEMVALLANGGNRAAAVRLEELWNDLQQVRTFSLFCGYPMQQLGGERLADFVDNVCGEHSRVVPAESYAALDRSDDRMRAIALLQQKARSLELEIAERERTEHALRRSEAELRDFLEQGLLGLHWVGADGKIVWANQAELDLLGYAADEYVGHHISEFYVDQGVAEDVLGRLAKHETIREHEVRLRCKDGSIKYVLVSSNVLWDGDTFVHTRCFTVDITGRKLAEQRLAVQYSVTRTLSEAQTLAAAARPILACVCETLGWEVGGLWLVDHHADVLRCREFWHVPHVELAAFEVVSRAQALAAGIGLPGRVWANGQPASIDDVLADANFARAKQAASAGLHAAFAFPISVGNEVLGVLDFFSRELKQPDADVLALMGGIGGQIGQFVERKRAEASADLERRRLRELFRRVPAAVALLRGREHVFEFANPVYVETVGRSDADDLLGKSVREALPQVASQGYLDLLDRVYRTGEPFVDRELCMSIYRAGSTTPQVAFLDTLLEPIRDEDGWVDGILVHAVDVTEQVRAREQVEELARQLEDQLESHMHVNRGLREMAQARDRAVADLQQLLAARDEFLSSAAHDLKNPLANMKAQAQLLQRRVARAGSVQAERVLAGLASIDASATKMTSLVDELLDTARMELGQPIELRRRPTDLVALVRRSAAEHQQTTERHRIRVEAVPALVGEWDPQRLDRVLTNLIENAIKYSPAGGEILLTVQQEGDSAVLSVRDHGLGIPAADQPHIFERFRRGTNVRGSIGGTGIGLAGVRSLVESHGGTIGFESEEGSGSTFSVWLPLGSPAEEASASGQSQPDAADPHR
jgi:PAS domain S-box-containing protein/excisionase family DNA binding protein